VISNGSWGVDDFTAKARRTLRFSHLSLGNPPRRKHQRALLCHFEELLEEGLAGLFDGGFIGLADGFLDPLAEGLGLGRITGLCAGADLPDDAGTVFEREGEDAGGERKVPADHAAVEDEVADDFRAGDVQPAGGGVEDGDFILTEGDGGFAVLFHGGNGHVMWLG
jgi:hypothetical protein